ncbi:MAG: hypothetical protein AAF711_03660 [Planctomycetota bacterium]
MEMTKQRKVLLGIIAAGLVALLVDRFVIGLPDSAEAAMQDISFETQELGPAAEDEPVAEIPALDAEVLPSYAGLTERLIEAQSTMEQDTAGREDPFALPEQWRTDKTKPLIDQETPVDTSDQEITRIFKLDGTVRSLIDEKEEMLAVISGGGLDGRAIRIGQKIRVPTDNGPPVEFKLVEVGSRYVIWKSERTGNRIVMQVEQVL